jgi:hypothetical protein
MRSVLIGLLNLALVGSGCSRSGGTQSKEAVQAAIERYLQKQSNIALNNMTLEVQEVKYQGDRAEAEVKFRSKQAPDLAVGVHYVLRRAGEQWEVQSSSAASGMGGNPHAGAAGQAPPPPPSGPALQPSH